MPLEQIPGLPFPIEASGPISGPPPAPGGFNWSNLIPYGINAGLNFLGNRMATGPIREQNEWLRRQQEQELARRNMLQGMAAPSMLAALGYRDPGEIQRMSSQIGGTGPAGLGAGGQQRYAVGGSRPSGAQGVLGAIGAGGGLAGGVMSLIPKVAGLGGPIGMAVGGAAALGSIAANKIGAGRRAANAFVGGAQNPFHQDLANISQSGMTDPKGAGQQLLQAWNDFYASAQQEIAKGGKQALVAKQALSTPNLINTVRTMAQQLGVQIPTLPTLGA